MTGQQVKCGAFSCLNGYLESLPTITIIVNNSLITLKSHLVFPILIQKCLIIAIHYLPWLWVTCLNLFFKSYL